MQNISALTYLFIFSISFLFQSCDVNEDENSDSRNHTLNYYNDVTKVDSGKECLDQLICEGGGCLYVQLALGGKRVLSSTEIRNLLSEYIIRMDTIQTYDVDSRLDSIGRIFISNLSNTNRIKFESYPCKGDGYVITDAAISDSDLRFQLGYRIGISKADFFRNIKHIQFINDEGSFYLDSQVICDTLNFIGRHSDSCIFFFNNNKLAKIIYSYGDILE
jgi:hypothetical protein